MKNGRDNNIIKYYKASIIIIIMNACYNMHSAVKNVTYISKKKLNCRLIGGLIIKKIRKVVARSESGLRRSSAGCSSIRGVINPQ